jgi:hemolysin activation/secretion protein
VQLAARVGGQRVFGDYPWFDAAFIGGRNNRGFHSHRFAGDASLYGSTELRAYLGGPVFASIFPVRFGLVGFVDTGRVWLKGESSNAWHPSQGGGVLLKPVGTTMVLRAVVAHSSEGTLFYAGSGFRF